MASEAKKKSSVEQHYFISPLQPQYEEELDRIRTEGDLTLIKVQTERKKLAELEAKLAQVNKQLRDRKQAPKPVKNGADIKSVFGKNKGLLAALVMSNTAGKGAAKQHLPTIPQSEKEFEAKRAPTTCISTAATGRQLHTEERLKVAMAERTVELQKLRLAIDETRRKRLEALATEKEMLKVMQEDEEDIKRDQEEIAQLKRQSTEMKNEIAASEQEFDTEKHAFRLERQRLLLELEELEKAEKQGDKEQASTPVSHKYSMFYNNIAHRRKQQVRTSKWKKVNLEQKIVSFEQKKRLLDRLIEETSVENLREFIQKYNDQEQTKAEVFARIEAQTATNASLNESIAQLTEDITRLSGATGGDANDDLEKPSGTELQKVLDTDDDNIKRWVKDADIFAEAVKFLRDPIYDIYKEFFPNNHAEGVFDSAAGRESGMMRRIGAIEERIMQFIMAKILGETEVSSAPNDSDTLRRLRQYQGRREQRDSITPPLSIVPPSTIKSENNQSKNGITEDEEEDPEDPAKDVVVIHSDVFRQRFNASTAKSASGNTTNASASSTRKNANTALNLC